MVVLAGGLNAALDSGVGLLWEVKMGTQKSGVHRASAGSAEVQHPG